MVRHHDLLPGTNPNDLPKPFFHYNCFGSVSQTSTLLIYLHGPSHHAALSILFDRFRIIHSNCPSSRFWRPSTSTIRHNNHHHHHSSVHRRDPRTLQLRHIQFTTPSQQRRRSQRFQLRRLHQQRRHRLRDRIRRGAEAIRKLWFQQCTAIYHD